MKENKVEVKDEVNKEEIVYQIFEIYCKKRLEDLNK